MIETQKKGRTTAPPYDAAAQGVGSDTDITKDNLPSEDEIVKVVKAGILDGEMRELLAIFTYGFIGHPEKYEETIRKIVKRGLRKTAGV